MKYFPGLDIFDFDFVLFLEILTIVFLLLLHCFYFFSEDSQRANATAIFRLRHFSCIMKSSFFQRFFFSSKTTQSLNFEIEFLN